MEQTLDNPITFDSGNEKNICVASVLAAFDIAPSQYRITFNAKTRKNIWPGILRRHGFAVRSRRSTLPKTVGAARKGILKLDDPAGTMYIIGVYRHILLLDQQGNTVVDTDPRVRDRRPILKVYAVYPQ